MPGIFIPEDAYLYGAHYRPPVWTDANETIGPGGATTVITLDQKGYGYGKCVVTNPSNIYQAYFLEFTATPSKVFGIGGYASSTGNTWSMRQNYSGSTLSDIGAFGTNIYLSDIYIDDANERIVFSWKSSSGNQTLSAQIYAGVFKGNHV